MISYPEKEVPRTEKTKVIEALLQVEI